MATDLRPNQAVQIFRDVYGGQKIIVNKVIRAAEKFVVNQELLSTSVANHIFVARTICRVTAASYIPRVVGSESAPTLMLDKTDGGGTAPGAGDDILSGAMALKGTADTVVNGALHATVAQRILAVGDTIATTFPGDSLTAVIGNLSVELEAVAGAIDNLIFTAQRICKVTAITYTPLVAGTDAGTVSLMVDRCQGTEAPGAGDNLMTGVLNLKGTIHTVQAGTLSATAAHLILEIGDRLAIDLTGAQTDVAGVLTVELEIQAQAGSLPK